MPTRISAAVIVGVVAGLLMVPGTADAKKRRGGQQFSVAFSCGDNDGSFAGAVAGTYATAISAFSGGVDTRVRARVVLQYPVRAGSDWVRATIGKDRAPALDCDSLLSGRFTFPVDLPLDGFFSGVVVIQARGSIDVTAQYTASGQGEVSNQVVKVAPSFAAMPRRPQAGEIICHVPPGSPENEHTIEVGHAAVPAHLRHGDRRGDCEDEVHHDFYDQP